MLTYTTEYARSASDVEDVYTCFYCLGKNLLFGKYYLVLIIIMIIILFLICIWKLIFYIDCTQTVVCIQQTIKISSEAFVKIISHIRHIHKWPHTHFQSQVYLFTRFLFNVFVASVTHNITAPNKFAIAIFFVFHNLKKNKNRKTHIIAYHKKYAIYNYWHYPSYVTTTTAQSITGIGPRWCAVTLTTFCSQHPILKILLTIIWRLLYVYQFFWLDGQSSFWSLMSFRLSFLIFMQCCDIFLW